VNPEYSLPASVRRPILLNAVLAKPIHAIWFIPARKVDLYQSLAALLCANLPSWLRDHPFGR
jgi:hypothetical protein